MDAHPPHLDRAISKAYLQSTLTTSYSVGAACLGKNKTVFDCNREACQTDGLPTTSKRPAILCDCLVQTWDIAPRKRVSIASSARRPTFQLTATQLLPRQQGVCFGAFFHLGCLFCKTFTQYSSSSFFPSSPHILLWLCGQKTQNRGSKPLPEQTGMPDPLSKPRCAFAQSSMKRSKELGR